ncbi:MAG: signal peptide peptidase SppA [Chitinophagales bacterium]|nr:signal peptide peptidase SppA [Chitinophagales bacterium]
MKQFLKFVLATITGLILTFFILMIIFSAIIGIATKDKTKPVAANSVLHLDLNYPIPERTSEDPFENFDFQSFEPDLHPGLNDILASIKSAKSDDDIKGIYIEMSSIEAGYTTIKAIRDALVDFRESGKFITAYGEYVDQRAYYLGSAADEVYLNPKGYVDFRGIGIQSMFFKGTLDKLDIDMQVFKTGDYKSAAESFTREDYSESNRAQIREYVEDVYNVILTDISVTREKSKDELITIADEMLAMMPSGAVSTGLIDGTWYFDEVATSIKDKAGIDQDDKLKFLSLKDYSANVKKSSGFSKDKIAIIYASGGIVDGEGEANQVDSKRFAKAIKKVREDEKIKGVVLRVNSPGGSALASEVIWRELKLTKDKKPVVVSMGDVAGSGGYYISCGADKIFAEPTTITGSIGVIGAVPNMEGFFNSKLGMTFDEIETGEYSVFGGGAKPLSEAEQQFIQRGVDSVYISFKSRVSKGRNIPMETVDALAGGRIYSGEDALDIKLVDELGGISDALDEVVELTGLEDYRVVNYPKRKNPLQQIMSSVSTESAARNLIKKEMGSYLEVYETLQMFNNWNPIQTRMFMDLDLK